MAIHNIHGYKQYPRFAWQQGHLERKSCYGKEGPHSTAVLLVIGICKLGKDRANNRSNKEGTYSILGREVSSRVLCTLLCIVRTIRANLTGFVKLNHTPNSTSQALPTSASPAPGLHGP